jgi:hypothetical protein
MPHTLRPLDPDTQYAALQERVYGLGQQFTHFEQATTRSFQQVGPPSLPCPPSSGPAARRSGRRS